MNSYPMSVVVVTMLCFLTFTVPAHAEQGAAYLVPTDPVKKVGDKIQLECRSPANYTGLHFESIEFKLQHNGTVISQRPKDHRVIGNYLYSVRTFSKAVTSKQDAGVYTCIITPSGGGKAVSVKTELFVVEANEITEFGEVGEETNMTCLGVGDQSNLPLVTFWVVDGKTVDMLVIPKTAKADVSKTFTCLVTSIQAMAAYGNISNAANKGAVAEFTRTLSVIEVTDCKDRSSCVLEARVYGETPVNISWTIDGKLYSPGLDAEKNVTTSKTSLLNLTKTTSIELRISDGPDNIWRKNMTRSRDPSSEGLGTSSNVGAIVGVIGGIGVIGGVAGAIVFYQCFIKKRRNGSPVENGGPETDPLDETALSEK